MFANCQNKFIHQKCLFQSFILNGRGPGAEGSFVEAGGGQRGTAYQNRGNQAYIVCNYLLTFARNKQMMLLS